MCPSVGWQAIIGNSAIASQTIPEPYKDYFRRSQGPEVNYVTGRSSVRQLVFEQADDYVGLGVRPILATAQHAALSDAITMTGALWSLSLANITASAGHGAPLSDQSDAIHTIVSDYSQPYSSVVCVPDTIDDTHAEARLAFPLLPNANSQKLINGNMSFEVCSQQRTVPTIAHPTILRRDIFTCPGPLDSFRTRWIELHSNVFQGSSIGAVIYFPRPQSDKTQKVLLCNVSAGWGLSKLSMKTLNSGVSAVSSKRRLPDALNNKGKGPSMQVTNTPTYEYENDIGSSPPTYELPFFPKQPINISESWTRFLDPSLEGLNTSLIDVVMRTQIFSCAPYATAEVALAGLVVNGLSQTSATSRLQGHVRTVGPNGDGGLDGNYWVSGKGNAFIVDPEQSVNWTKFYVESTLEGHAYNTLTTPPKIAIAVLSVYCIIALAHVFYAGITGRPNTYCYCTTFDADQNSRYLVHMLGLDRRSHSVSL